MNTLLRISIVLILFVLLHPEISTAQNQSKGYDPAIEPYVSFLKSKNQNSIDYILRLFQTKDIVILCERAHPEVTQYELIQNIISDRRFIEQVGHIFTELGTSSIRTTVEALVMSNGIDTQQVTNHLCRIYQNFGDDPIWEKTNYYMFLKYIYNINQNVPKHLRIHVYPSGIPFQWKDMTKDKYKEHQQLLNIRDKIIAEQIISTFNTIQESQDKRKKALIIMNYRHAFPHIEIKKGSRVKQIQNVGGFLMEAYPGKVANIMLNSVRLLPGSTDDQVAITAIQQGKWDASFSVLGDQDLGFDFNGSPFGNDSFDYFPFSSDNKYQDIFTGFIFYKPLKAHKMLVGIPGPIDPQFADELIRRYQIINDQRSPEEIKKEIENLKSIKEYDYSNKEVFTKTDHEEKIKQWIKNAAY